MNTMCVVKRCGLPARNRGLCNAHYQQLRQSEAGVIPDMGWQPQAACAGQPRFTTWELPQQFLLCDTCPVRAACYQAGKAQHATDGVWGGVWFDTDGHPDPAAGRPGKQRTITDDAEIARLVADGMTHAGVAARFGCSTTTIARRLTRMRWSGAA